MKADEFPPLFLPNAKRVDYNKDEQWYVIPQEEATDDSVNLLHGSSARYSGKLLDGKPHGHGTLVIFSMPSGFSTTYVGGWKDGRFIGKGKYQWIGSSHSHEYVGNWKDGKKHGCGHEKALGWEYCGLYENDEQVEPKGLKKSW